VDGTWVLKQVGVFICNILAFLEKYIDYKQQSKSGQSFTSYKAINGHRYSLFYMVRQMTRYAIHLKVPLRLVHSQKEKKSILTQLSSKENGTISSDYTITVYVTPQ
jgi:hypothetical protein